MAKIGIDARMYSTRFTGIGQYTARLIEQLQNIDTENEYIIFIGPREYAKLELTNPNFEKRLTTATHYSLAEQTVFLKQLNDEKCDLVHFTHFNVPILYSKPYVVTIHDLTLSLFPGQSRTSWLHKIAYQKVINTAARKSQSIIAISENTKKDIKKFLHAPEEKIEVIYEAASEKFHPNQDQQETTKVQNMYGIDRPFFFYTGVWRKHKNIPCLIRAFESFCDRYPSADYQLVLTGEEDNTREITELIESSAYADRIITPGFIPEGRIPILMAKATTYVFPSLYEGFGLPPLEAMASGVPVIAANTTSIPEVCADAVLYFNAEDDTQLTALMGRVHAQPELTVQLSEKGLVRSKDFSWKKMAEETIELYKKHTQE